MFKKTVTGPYSAAILFTVLTGFSFLGIKGCQNYANQLSILIYRYDFAFIAAAAIWIFGFFKSNIKSRGIKGANLNMLFLAAASYIGFMILQVVGIFYTTSVVGSIIFSITPIITQIIASVILDEKSTVKQNIFVVVTVAALIYMIIAENGDMEFSYTGIICLIMSSIAMAVSSTCMRYIRKDFTPFDISAVICAAGFILFNITGLIYSLWKGNPGIFTEPVKESGFIIGTAYLGIGCILFTSQLISYMLSKMTALKATVFGNVATAISIIAGVFILNEGFHIYHFVCAVLIIAGVIGVSICGNNGSGGKISGDKTQKCP